MKILVIEDDEKIAQFICVGLQREGHTVDIATTGTEGADLLAGNRYDAAVLDIMLPGVSGLDILRNARRRGDATPVLVLSAKGELDDRVRGLEAGADDYMPKPFAFSELYARIHAITRRASGAQTETRLTAGDVTLDLLTRTCTRDGRKIELQPREFTLLELLLRNVNHPLDKTTIQERIWGLGIEPQTNIVDVLVCKLRNKIDSGFESKRIQTIRGVGYVFRSEA
ncbi:MAG: response regulator transcription factor [Kiritimatiellae bacterium]|nr:response regulator transcription factor [Kiritimatiellia bacterium]